MDDISNDNDNTNPKVQCSKFRNFLSIFKSKKSSLDSHHQNEDFNLKKKQKRRADSKKQDQKAAKTLSAILLAFIITWTPYNINVVLNALCNNCIDKYQVWQDFGNHLLLFQ
jgi:hypothetical protein